MIKIEWIYCDNGHYCEPIDFVKYNQEKNYKPYECPYCKCQLIEIHYKRGE